MSAAAAIIQRHLSYLAENPESNLAVALLKPDADKRDYLDFIEYCRLEKLTILAKRHRRLSLYVAIGLYPKLFSFHPTDLVYGIKWKQLTIQHLCSGRSRIFVVEGERATSKLQRFKFTLRRRHGKISRPKEKLSGAEFLERVIRNRMHVADSHASHSAAWLLLS